MEDPCNRLQDSVRIVARTAWFVRYFFRIYNKCDEPIKIFSCVKVRLPWPSKVSGTNEKTFKLRFQ